MTLLDTPGLRPRLDDLDPPFLALLVAAGVVEPFAGLKSTMEAGALVQVLLKAWNRHAELSSSAGAAGGTQEVAPKYMHVLQCERTDDPNEM